MPRRRRKLTEEEVIHISRDRSLSSRARYRTARVIIIILLVVLLCPTQILVSHQQRLDHALFGATRSNNTANALIALGEGANPDVLFWEDEPELDAFVFFWQYKLHRLKQDPGLFERVRYEDLTTPLILATRNHNLILVKELLSSGAHTDRVGFHRLTALHIAASDGDLATVQMLLDHGADVNSRTMHGDTPLMVAATTGNVNVVRLLLQRGANPFLKLRMQNNWDAKQLVQDLVNIIMDTRYGALNDQNRVRVHRFLAVIDVLNKAERQATSKQ